MPHGEQASFAYLKNGVLMASAAGARYYSLSGELYAEEVRNLEHPVLSASKEAGVVYDAGGEDLFVFRGWRRPSTWTWGAEGSFCPPG